MFWCFVLKEDAKQCSLMQKMSFCNEDSSKNLPVTICEEKNCADANVQFTMPHQVNEKTNCDYIAIGTFRIQSPPNFTIIDILNFEFCF